jgi:hypothetical protein
MPRPHAIRNRLAPHRRPLHRARPNHSIPRHRTQPCRSCLHGPRPQAGLTLVDALASEPFLARYHLLPSVHADLLYKLGHHPEARTAFERAAALTRNTRERDLLLTRAASCETEPTNPQGK